MATIKQVANKIGNDLNESYPNVQSLFDVLKRGFKDMENVSGGGSGGSEVDWTQLQASGTKIAEIEIDGDKTNVYAPASQTIAVSQIQTTGTKIASINLDGVSTDLYAPNGGGGGSSLTLKAQSSATGTYADKLTEIAAAFNQLTNDEKLCSFLLFSTSKLAALNINTGSFSAVWSDGSAFKFTYADLSTHKLYGSGSGTAVTDQSSTSNDVVFKLYTLA